MTAPFPGMDPYLEHPACWRDFHQRFITCWCDWLADHLPDHYEVRKLPPGDYYPCVARGDQRPLCEVYAWKRSEALTRIGLPLKPSEPDLLFDLPGLAEAYRRGRYARSLRDSAAPPVPLSQENARYISERLCAWKPAG